VGVTMGDVAGVGPEVIARAWPDRALQSLCQPIVIGDPEVLRKALELTETRTEVKIIGCPEDADPSPDSVSCMRPARATDAGALADVRPGLVDPRAGRAAYEFLITAIDLALQGKIDAITTLPLNKEALRLAGVVHPGHTEILAERCGARDHAMMLYLAEGTDSERQSRESGGWSGLGVVHVTLHVALRDVFALLTMEAVASKIRLADESMRPLTGGRPPRIAVSSLNPHAGEHGLFGVEEIRIIRPAVELMKSQGVDVDGPFPNDTLYHQALSGAFDAVVAMYHDQGHIALKTAGFRRAVNVTLGLPIVRTSVAHGTAFDIAWRGVADPSSLIEAVRVASRLVAGRRHPIPG
jgi:4-hydroxythreonine-4-phosphate dehydrogenase